MDKQKLKEIANMAWRGAANAFRMYPNNKHTFVDYWTGSESQFDQYLEKPKEWIICAANFYDDGIERTHKPRNITTGFVICGRRHHNCISTFAQMVGFPYSPESMKLSNTEVQGFMTNQDRFVDRKEAFQIARLADQIYGPNKGEAENSIGLTSEDLY